MQIKGKGEMTTYFMYGNKEREIPFESSEYGPPAAKEENGQAPSKGNDTRKLFSNI